MAEIATLRRPDSSAKMGQAHCAAVLMHEISFIHDLAIIMLTAGVVTVVFHLLRQPVVLGYIVAGVIIGPHTPPYSLVTDEETIRTLGQLGVVFLLFSLGLEFSVGHLRKVGATALVAALGGIVTMLWLGYEIGLAFGWRTMDAVFLGAMLSISSTTITIKALDNLGLRREAFAQSVFAILIIEDVLAIGMIALLSSIAKTGSVETGEVLRTLGGLMVFLVASLVIGILTVPRLLDFVAKFNRDEMLLIGVLGLLFGFCLLVVKLGYSVALGAFIIGAIIAESRSLRRVEHLIEPIRDMFSAVFFVTIGLMLDPHVLVDYAGPVAVITVVVVVGKVISRTFGALAAGQRGRTSMRIGMSLAQIGEFSFIIAALGTSLNVTSAFLYPIAVAVSAITTLLTPYLMRARRSARATHPRARAERAAPHHAHVHRLAAAPALRRRSRGRRRTGAAHPAAGVRQFLSRRGDLRRRRVRREFARPRSVDLAAESDDRQYADLERSVDRLAAVPDRGVSQAQGAFDDARRSQRARRGPAQRARTPRDRRSAAARVDDRDAASRLRAEFVHPAAGRTADRRARHGRADPRARVARAGQAALAPADRAARYAHVEEGRALSRAGMRARQLGSAASRNPCDDCAPLNRPRCDSPRPSPSDEQARPSDRGCIGRSKPCRSSCWHRRTG